MFTFLHFLIDYPQKMAVFAILSGAERSRRTPVNVGEDLFGVLRTTKKYFFQ